MAAGGPNLPPPTADQGASSGADGGSAPGAAEEWLPGFSPDEAADIVNFAAELLDPTELLRDYFEQQVRRLYYTIMKGCVKSVPCISKMLAA